jgi:Rrf2 family protein
VKLSTKGRYGLRAMLDLAMHSEDENVSINSISERQNISENYLEQLIAKLKKAELVNSTRGAQGGYSLAKPMEEISVGDILRALEGDLNPVDCALINGNSQCSDMDCCVTKSVWKKISDSINDVVDKITLRELCNDSKELEAKNIKTNSGCKL